MSKRSEEKQWLADALADGQITQADYDARIARMNHRKHGAGAKARRKERRASQGKTSGLTMQATAEDLKPHNGSL